MTTRSPEDWLRVWASIYSRDSGYDENEYRDLISKHRALTAEDFRRIGKWKDRAATEKRWKPHVASVAYEIWEQAANESPQCPEESGVAAFLADWSSRKAIFNFKRRSSENCFGPPRATTLLHFLSGGAYPIFDSRVRIAIARLLAQRELPNTVDAYLNQYIPCFRELAVLCKTTDFRKLDQALFSYGALDKRIFRAPHELIQGGEKI